MPTYNRAPVLPRAISSVLNQDFANFELLVIDDGSTDDSAGVVAGLAEPRVRYCRFEVNRGIGAARREGISRSRGKLVAFLDADDCWKPGKLTKLVAAFTRYPLVDLVFSDFENVNCMMKTRERGFVTVAAAFELLDISPLGEDWWAIAAGAPEALMRQNFVGTSSIVVIRRSVFERAGNFREDLSGPEDLEMWWRAAVLGARFAYTTDVLVQRHKDGQSITAQTRAFGAQMLRALDACEDTARRLGRLELLDHVGQARRRTWCDLAEACAHQGRLRDAWYAFRSGVPNSGRLRALRHVAMAVGRPWITAVREALGSPSPD
jgi:glycosyltransferase involved in cell wall biosynthesis